MVDSRDSLPKFNFLKDSKLSPELYEDHIRATATVDLARERAELVRHMRNQERLSAGIEDYVIQDAKVA